MTSQILAIRIVTAAVMRTLCRQKSNVLNHVLNLRFRSFIWSVLMLSMSVWCVAAVAWHILSAMPLSDS